MPWVHVRACVCYIWELSFLVIAFIYIFVGVLVCVQADDDDNDVADEMLDAVRSQLTVMSSGCMYWYFSVYVYDYMYMKPRAHNGIHVDSYFFVGSSALNRLKSAKNLSYVWPCWSWRWLNDCMIVWNGKDSHFRYLPIR